MAKKSTPVPNETRQNLSRQTWDEKLYAISQYLEKVKFTPRMMGVDEADVWRKLEKLCELYEDALTAERMHAAQLEKQCDDLRATAAQMGQKYRDLENKSKQLLVAYQSLTGKGGENG